MPSDFENGTRKTIDISVKAEKMTVDILKSALQEFLSGKSKLDNIEVSDRNIGDFLKTARKYDVDFALKKDRNNSPTYHVFFSAAKTEDFKRAFSEYIGKGQGKKRGEFTREQMQQQAQKVANRPRKQKQRENKGEQKMRFCYFLPFARSDIISTACFYAEFSGKELQLCRSAPKS